MESHRKEVDAVSDSMVERIMEYYKKIRQLEKNEPIGKK